MSGSDFRHAGLVIAAQARHVDILHIAIARGAGEAALVVAIIVAIVIIAAIPVAARSAPAAIFDDDTPAHLVSAANPVDPCDVGDARPAVTAGLTLCCADALIDRAAAAIAAAIIAAAIITIAIIPAIVIPAIVPTVRRGGGDRASPLPRAHAARPVGAARPQPGGGGRAVGAAGGARVPARWCVLPPRAGRRAASSAAMPCPLIRVDASTIACR